MIALNENPSEKKVLTLGLETQEKEWLEIVARKCHFQLESAKDEIDLANRAKFKIYDLFILGQNDEFSDLSYMIWLLKGLCNRSHIILIYTIPPEDKINRRQLLPDLTVFTRPFNLGHLYDCICAVLQERTPTYRHRSFFSQWNLQNLFSKVSRG